MTKPHFPQPPTSNRLSPVLDPVLDAIRSLLDRQERVLVAIDGRCRWAWSWSFKKRTRRKSEC